MTITRDEFLARIKDLPVKEVEIEGFGTIRIRRMSAQDRTDFELGVQGQNKRRIRGALAAATVINDDGSPMFTAADIDALNAGDAMIIDKVFDAAMRHNVMSESDVEELAGN